MIDKMHEQQNSCMTKCMNEEIVTLRLSAKNRSDGDLYELGYESGMDNTRLVYDIERLF